MRVILLLLLFGGITASTFAQSPLPPGSSLTARSYLLIDFHSQQALAAHNADERIDPASLTKLMTAYLTFSALKQQQIQATQTVPVSDRALKVDGSRMFIEPRKP